MKKRRLSFKPFILLVPLLGFVLLIVFALLFLRSNRNHARGSSVPPSLIVHTPISGEIIDAPGQLLTRVTATGQRPIARIELWLDGNLLDTQTPAQEDGELLTFFATSLFEITEGDHTFSARAVDSAGLIGQSLPVIFHGRSLVISKEGQTLEDIADELEEDPSTLQALNPGIGPGELPGGKPIVVPPDNSAGTGGSSQPQPPSGQIQPPPPINISSDLPMLEVYNPAIGNLINLFASALPKAPSGLAADVENCTVRLQWLDTADNETQFKVWLQAVGGPAQLIATLQGSMQTGPAWYEFAAPTVGFYSIWVESANNIGTQSSEPVFFAIASLGCAPGIATELRIEAIDMSVVGGYDRGYCYLSLEGAPEKRVPSYANDFFQILGGWGDIANWVGGKHRLLLPIPADDEVTLEGECWAWQGNSVLNKLGTFSSSVPKTNWDGSRLELNGGNYTIGYRIQLHGPVQVSGSFTYTDYTLPAPSNLTLAFQSSNDPVENAKLARLPTLDWDWTGDSSRLTSFSVMLEGEFFRWADPNWRSVTFLLPTSCGGIYNFQVTASSGEAQSAPSTQLRYEQAPCQVFAEVQFQTIELTAIDDGQPGSCDVAEIRYKIWVNHELREFWGYDTTVDVGCGITFFDRLPARSPQENDYASVDTFILPIDPHNTGMEIGSFFVERDPGVYLYSHPSYDDLCGAKIYLNMPYEDWGNHYDSYSVRCGQGLTSSSGYDADGFINFTVRGFRAAPPPP